MMIVGNDISSYQADIDWNVYKNNSNFVIIRSSYGNGYFDTWFARNRDEARRVGLPVGFYHYAYPQYNTPEAEASWFCRAVWDLKPGEVLALDFEESYGGDVVSWCHSFLSYVSQHFNGIKPLIYLNQALVKKYAWKPVVDAGYGLWLASYNPDGEGNIGVWPFMAMQQTSSTQHVPGILGGTGNVDRDVFFGDTAMFKKYGYTPATPDPTIPPPPPVVPPEGSTTDTSSSASSTTPPPIPAPMPGIDYKSYLLRVKEAANEKEPWWYAFVQDQRLTDIKKILAESGV